MIQYALLIALLGFTACGKDSKKSKAEVPEQDNPDSPQKTDEGKTSDQPCQGEACPPTPTQPVTPPGTPTPETDDPSTLPEGLVIFKAADHCTAKPSKAYADCKPIPRKDVEVKFELDAVSETNSKTVNSNLSFLSKIQYNYFCEGREDDTFLVFGAQKTPIIHGTGEVTFSKALRTNNQVELIRNARSFSTVSKNCSIVITGRKTVLSEPSLAQLKNAYEQADSAEQALVKSWLEKEALRLKDMGASDYDMLIKSLPTL